MDKIFEVKDKSGRIIYLSEERWKHILKHPHMHKQLENIQDTLKNPTKVRFFEDDKTVLHFYRDFKHRDQLERYLLVSVRYLNGSGYIITSFFTNKITGQKWQTK